MKVWEVVEDKKVGNIGRILSERLKVPGGWVLQTTVFRFGGESAHVAQIFIKDDDHAWKVKEVSS